MNRGSLIKMVVVLLILLSASANGQDILTLEEAIKIGLENNFNIQIARNSAKISSNNKGKGIAGFLPTLDVSGNYQLSNAEEESNSNFSYGNTETTNWGGSISLNWTLFDGFKMFIDRKKFNELARLGEYRARNIIENNVVAISKSYFNLVRQEQLVDVARDSKDVSRTRLNKAKVRKELGGASSTDYLNAQVAYNSDQSSLLNQELQVTIAREQLNLILGRDPNTPVSISKSISVPQLDLEIDDIQRLANDRNSGLMVAYQNKAVADRNLHGAISPFLPRLSLNASYGYSDRTLAVDGAGFGDDIFTESKNASVGLLLSFNLFNGGMSKIDLQNARLEARNQGLALQDAHNQLTGTVQQSYETFIKQQQLVELEEQNLIAARQNLELIQDRYLIGAAGSLEFRDAQVSLIRAQTALIAARFQARITRLEISRLIGDLEIE